ncbi:MAG: hypothetical protein U9Q21_02890 [Candidatus Auribacterota bacterium]|nr:hypothetical protein [Candidatus Auribacterota bacterium]
MWFDIVAVIFALITFFLKKKNSKKKKYLELYLVVHLDVEALPPLSPPGELL